MLPDQAKRRVRNTVWMLARSPFLVVVKSVGRRVILHSHIYYKIRLLDQMFVSRSYDFNSFSCLFHPQRKRGASKYLISMKATVMRCYYQPFPKQIPPKIHKQKSIA